MLTRKEKIIFGLVIAALYLVFMCAGYAFVCHELDKPTVVFSWNTKECTQVIFVDGTAGSCADLEKIGDYDWVWGE